MSIPPNTFSQSVIIKSIEQNMECVYEARRQLLESASWPTMAPIASHTASLSPTPLYGGGHSPTSGQQLSPVGEVEEEEEEEENCKIGGTSLSSTLYMLKYKPLSLQLYYYNVHGDCSLTVLFSFAVAGSNLPQTVVAPVMVRSPSVSDGSGAGRMPSIMEENG